MRVGVILVVTPKPLFPLIHTRTLNKIETFLQYACNVKYRSEKMDLKCSMSFKKPLVIGEREMREERGERDAKINFSSFSSAPKIIKMIELQNLTSLIQYKHPSVLLIPYNWSLSSVTLLPKNLKKYGLLIT